MDQFKWKKISFFFFLIFSLISAGKFVTAEELNLRKEKEYYVEELNLTKEEKHYIEDRKIISAASIEGVAPLHYRNSKGEIVGIAIRTLDIIAAMTGLTFEYALYESIEEAFNSQSDIIFGLSSMYISENILVTDSYLQSKSIIFMNSSLDSNELTNQKFAGIKGGKLSDGVNEENVIYYNTREEALDAVEVGEAGYGYGNEYSIAYYGIRNGYENIISVPTIKESREYAIGLSKEDETLLSILNKSIQQIDETQMNQLILEEAGNIEKRITFSMLLNEYGVIIFIISFIVISILLLITYSNIRAKKELRLQNKRHQLLSDISNECIFEYNVKSNTIQLSEKCSTLFELEDDVLDIHRPLKEIILSEKNNGNAEIIHLKLNNGDIGVFKVIKSDIYESNNKKYYTIGKLTDVSEEVAEKKRLIIQSETDGLTNLYNNMTTKKLINERINSQDKNLKDALILIDCDEFKEINDTLGHLEGDEALKNVSEVLKNNFRQKDIIGRIGGDEFCVYMKDIPSEKSVERKCASLIPQINKIDKNHNLTFSIGIAFLNEEKNYKELFSKADSALYQAKAEGKSKVVIFTGKPLE